jgi:hypothetical protein
MLEGSGSGDSKRLFKFSNELIRIESVKEINITGTSVNNLYGKISAVRHKDSRRFLIGITTIFKF